MLPAPPSGQTIRLRRGSAPSEGYLQLYLDNRCSARGTKENFRGIQVGLRLRLRLLEHSGGRGGVQTAGLHKGGAQNHAGERMEKQGIRSRSSPPRAWCMARWRGASRSPRVFRVPAPRTECRSAGCSRSRSRGPGGAADWRSRLSVSPVCPTPGLAVRYCTKPKARNFNLKG